MPVRPVVNLRVSGNRGHLFYFRKMVTFPDRSVAPGTLVDVVDRDGQPVGAGFWNPHSEISIRILAPGRDVPDTVIADRLKAAVALRHGLLGLPAVTDAYRVCHAEGDGLTGLVVDRFGPVVVAQLFSGGWLENLPALRAALAAEFPKAAIHVTADERVQNQEGFTLPEAHSPAPVVVTEHGVQFKVNFATGHKTGFFCDQRENRRHVAALAAGRTVLDLCSYTGGFAVHAAKAGARRVIGVDLDEDALETAKRNAKLNGVAVEWRHGDVFDVLKAMPAGERHDLVVLDPPKLARNKLELGRARHAYFDMNRLALGVVAPGGTFVTCSCSGMISEGEFLDILWEAARAANRELRIFRIAGAGPDHPVSTLYPEGRYLKAVFSTVV